MSVHQFDVHKINGELESLSIHQGSVLLIVNTATKCGLAGQFDGLELLYQTYAQRGFKVLGVPSNQFKDQEPGENEQVEKTCKLNFGVTFPLYAKVEVNGPNEAPLYTYLKQEKRGFLKPDIKWNFTKFLIDQQGRVVRRFSPTTKPEKIEKYIEALLDQQD